MDRRGDNHSFLAIQPQTIDGSSFLFFDSNNNLNPDIICGPFLSPTDTFNKQSLMR